ncbi:MAG: hypothetical protein ACYCSZ_06755 [Burkholderiales bacterium]
MSTTDVSMIQFSNSDIISLTGVVATVVVGIVSWLISAYMAKKAMRTEELSYRMRVTPLLNNRLFKQVDKLKIEYKGEQIDQLVFFEVDIVNSGNIAIKNPPIVISSLDATYIIPAYLEDVPPGYDDLWEIVREDGETCRIEVDHINPGQIVKARFLMDNMPPGEPTFACAVPDLRVRLIADIEISSIATGLLEVFYPNLARVVKALTQDLTHHSSG